MKAVKKRLKLDNKNIARQTAPLNVLLIFTAEFRSIGGFLFASPP